MKNLMPFICCILFVFSFFYLSVPSITASNNQVNVHLVYQKEVSLTPEQKNLIIKGIPDEVITQNVTYTFIYGACPISQETTTSSTSYEETSGITSSSFASSSQLTPSKEMTKAPSKEVLPQTGDTLMPTVIMFLSIALLTLAVYLICKDKRTGGFFIVIIGMGFGMLSTHTQYSADETRQFGYTISQAMTLGDKFTYTPEIKLNDLCYLGYIVNQIPHDENTTTEFTTVIPIITTDYNTEGIFTTVVPITTTDHETVISSTIIQESIETN